MKKVIAVTLLICMLLSLVSCNLNNAVRKFNEIFLPNVYLEGLDRYDPELSHISTTKGLMPEEFLTKFPCQDGNFYFDDRLFTSSTERALLWLRYDDATYEKAKAYYFEAMKYLQEEIGTVDGYHCHIHYTYSEGDLHYPYVYKVFGYNDETKTLLLLGVNLDGIKDSISSNLDFETQIKTVFSKDFMNDKK